MDLLTARHDCRNEEKCPRIEWIFVDMHGASDFVRCTFNVVMHANFTKPDGWEYQRQMPTMTFGDTAVCELHAVVRGLIHEGGLFTSADDVHVHAVRIS